MHTKYHCIVAIVGRHIRRFTHRKINTGLRVNVTSLKYLISLYIRKSII